MPDGREWNQKFFVEASKIEMERKFFEDFPLTFQKAAHIIAPSTARALRQGSRGALFAFLRRLTHPIRTKALREKSTAEARPQRAGDGGSRGALFAFLRRLTHPIRTKALREKSTAEARPQRAGDGGSPAQETAERTLLSRERNAQASMGAGGDRYIAMACQSRKSGPQVVRAS